MIKGTWIKRQSNRGQYIFFNSTAQVCIAPLTSKGEVHCQKCVSPTCDPSQGEQDAAPVTQHNTEVS